jgi:hypothetical protein
MQTHDLTSRVVKDEVDVIEWDHARESLGEVMEERLKIAMRRDGLGHLEERLILLESERQDVSVYEILL